MWPQPTDHIHATPAPTGQQATSAQPAAPSRTRPLLVAMVVGAASLLVVLAAAANFLRLRARPRAAT